MGKQKKAKENKKTWSNIVALSKKHNLQLPPQLDNVPPEFEGSSQHQELVFAFLEKAAMFLEPLDKERSTAAVREGARAIHRSFDHLQNLMPKTVHFGNEPEPMTLACKPGCNYCCTIRVTAVAPEILTLAFYLKKKLNADEMGDLLSRISAFEAETATLTALKQVLRSTMCPLNVDGLCIGYANRPTGCIGYHSFNLQKCIEDHQNPEGEAMVPQDPQRWMFRDMHVQALEAGMRAFGLDNTELEFIPALRIALTDDDAGEKYVRGETVFTEADRPEVRTAQREDLSNRGLSNIGMREQL